MGSPINKVHKPKAAIVGVGLIGGSLGMAWKNSGVVSEVIGIARRDETIAEAISVGAIDRGTLSLHEGVATADVVIIAAPVRSIVDLYKAMQPALKAGCIVSDVGSTKREICRAIWSIENDHHTFIGGHPMAGSEKEGVLAADPYLFQNAVYVLTPGEHCPEEALTTLNDLILATGAKTMQMTPEHHDEIVAAVSHVPHMVAVSLVLAAAERGAQLPELLQLAAGGFRDTTRVASGPEDVWADISLSNAQPIAQGIERLEAILAQLKDALRSRDKEKLWELLSRARQVRNSIPAKAKGIMQAVFDVVVHVVDRPGAIKDVTTVIGDAGINIIDIEILRVREGEGGTLRLGFEGREQMEKALQVLISSGYRARSRS